MKRRRRRVVLVLVEDTYAPHAVRRLIEFASKEVQEYSILANCSVKPKHMRICSSKFEREARALIKQCRGLIVLVDAEDKRPEERRQWVKEKHHLDLTNDMIIVAEPCLEGYLCRVLGLSCGDSCDSVLSAVNDYARRRWDRDYDKAMLPRLVEEVWQRNRELMLAPAGWPGQLLKALRRLCTGSGCPAGRAGP